MGWWRAQGFKAVGQGVRPALCDEPGCRGYGPRREERRGRQTGGKPDLYWDRLLRNVVTRARAGTLVSLPVQWTTYQGHPRCVRCGAILEPEERAERRQVGLLRISGCVDCREEVWAILDELEEPR